MSLTATIAGVSVDLKQGALSRPDRIDEHTTCTVTVVDTAGTALYQKGQPIVITDSILGTIFTGFVNQPQATKLYPNAGLLWNLTCIGKGDYLAAKRTSNRTYANQYAGTIAVDQVQRYLSAEGVTAKAALRWDEMQTDWAAGTLTGTTATTNAGDGNPGDGDLELALAGATTTISVATASDFNAGSYTGTSLVSGAVQPTATSAIKFVADCTLNNAGNLYSYLKIWGGSQVLGTGYYFIYDVWIDPSSPEAKVAMDIVFSDGTTLRDNYVYTDTQNLSPHPSTDLAGLAGGQWYHRQFWLNNFNGKTISYITVVSEGDKVGTYTAWFKNVAIVDGSFSTVLTVFNGTLNTSQQMQTSGYASSSVSVVNTYAMQTYNAQGEGSSPWSSAPTWQSPAYSIDAVKILQSGYLSYDATVPDGTLLYLKYTLDYPSSSVAAIICENNATLPLLPAGLNVASRSLTLFAQFYRDPAASTPASPEVCPALSKITLTLKPSYTMSKTDVQFACTQASDWTQAGTTLTNTATSLATNKVLSLSGYENTFESSYGSTNLYSTGTPGVTLSNKTVALTVTTGTDAKLKLNDPGQYQNFTLECDIYVSSSYSAGVVYRTTNWGNNNDSYAYSVTVSASQILLGHGTNSTGAGGFTSISGPSITLTSGNWHRLKVVVNGSSHKVYLDDIKFIDATDGTYTAAGYVGLRIYNNSGSTQTAQFHNFGVFTALSGTWLSPSISLTSATTYGTSVISWRDQNQDDTNCSIKVESTINGGTTWATCTNGSVLPTLTAGQSLSGVSLQLRITLTTTTASAIPGIDNLVVRVLQAFSSSGTRISPSLSLAGVGRAGTTLVNWNANTPTGTSLTVQTSINGGSTYQTVAAAGNAISGITVQPDPIEDLFTSNTSSSYTTSSFGSGTGTQTWDTTHSRLNWSGANNAVMQYNSLTTADCVVMADFDEADNAGLACRITGASTMYALYLYDSQATTFSLTNTWTLYKIVSGTFTQLATGNSGTGFTLARGTYRRFTLSCIGTTISASVDGTTLASVTDSSITAAGKAGLIGGALSRVYSLRLQGQGQDVSALSVLTKVTLTSTDPTVTPQLLDMQTFVSSPDIGPGVLVPSVAYQRTFISDNLADLNTKSNYWMYIRNDGSLVFQARTATPAPFVLSSLNSQVIAGQTINDVLVNGAELDNSGDAYRNRQILTGAIATTEFTEIKTGDGTTTSWSLNYPVAAPPSEFTLNGQPVTFGVKDVDTGKQYYYQVGSTSIDQDSSQSVLEGTDELSITYLGSSTQDVVLDNTSLPDTITQAMMAAIDGSSGIVEAVLDVSGTPTTVDAATTQGNQLLQRYGNIGRTFKFRTLRSGLAPGQQIALFVPEFNLANVQMLVTEVGVTLASAPGVTGGLLYTWQMTCTEAVNLGSWVKLFTNALG